MKKNFILIIIFILLLIPMFFFKSENIIKDLTFNQIEDNKSPLNYKKEYTFIIKELSGKNNTLEFNIINHCVEVYISDNLVYELKNEETKKDTLVKVPLEKKDINKKVVIILKPTQEDVDNNLDLKIK